MHLFTQQYLLLILAQKSLTEAKSRVPYLEFEVLAPFNISGYHHHCNLHVSDNNRSPNPTIITFECYNNISIS